MMICPKDKAKGCFVNLKEGQFIDDKKLQKIRIPAEAKKNFIKILDKKYCINADHLLSGKSVSEIESERIWKDIIRNRLSTL